VLLAVTQGLPDQPAIGEGAGDLGEDDQLAVGGVLTGSMSTLWAQNRVPSLRKAPASFSKRPSSAAGGYGARAGNGGPGLPGCIEDGKMPADDLSRLIALDAPGSGVPVATPASSPA